MAEFFGMGCLILGILLLIALIEVRDQRKINSLVMTRLRAVEAKCRSLQTTEKLRHELKNLRVRKEVWGAS